VIAMYAAALRPRAVRSLTVSEPGCLRVAAGNPQVDAQIAGGELLYGQATGLAPLEFLRAFRGGVGSTHATPGQLTGELLHGVRYEDVYAYTQSMVLRSATGTMRIVDAYHPIDLLRAKGLLPGQVRTH